MHPYFHMGRAYGELNTYPDLDLRTTYNQKESLVKKEKTKLDPETQYNTQIPQNTTVLQSAV